MAAFTCSLCWSSEAVHQKLSKHVSIAHHGKHIHNAFRCQSLTDAATRSGQCEEKNKGFLSFEKEKYQKAIQFASDFANNTKERAISALIDALFKPSDEPNINFLGNFAPVPEIGDRIAVKVIEGEIPKDFPMGIYIRNGPNPLFGGKLTNSPFGKLDFSWFEGDGMLHATYFGPNGEVSYQNKYIGTKGYNLEKKRRKKLWLNTLDGDSMAMKMAYFFNLLRFGEVNKGTANTSLCRIGNRVFAVMEADKPYEINTSDLSTVGVWDWNGEWDRPFTVHSKMVGDTKETVVFGFSPVQPYYVLGVLSADGETFLHKCDIGLDRPTFSHEVAITERYNIVMDFPLYFDLEALMNGRSFQHFEAESRCRIGVMPRYGDAKSIKWFDVEPNFTFHVVNSYEEGDEVVLRGCRARRPFTFVKPDNNEDLNQQQMFSRGIVYCPPEDAVDPNVDGALFARVHEWRFNLTKGTVMERDITNNMISMDMPRINSDYTGYKNEYAYLDVIDTDASAAAGLPKYGRIAKLYLEEKEDGVIKTEFHDAGPNIFFSEPLFVSRPGGKREDDGWIVTYVHDEIRDISEVHIIDAQNFSKPCVARVELPQRVPYGFHSIFIR